VGQSALFTQTPTTAQLFPDTTNTVIYWGNTILSNSTGTTGLSYSSITGAYTNMTLTALPIEVVYSLVWDASMPAATYVDVDGVEYGLTQYNSYVFTNKAIFLLGVNKSFRVYNQNSADGSTLQTSSNIVITLLTAGTPGSTGSTGSNGTGPTGPQGPVPNVITFTEGPTINMDTNVSAGSLNNYVLGNYSFFKLSNASSGYNVTGFAGGVAGRQMILVNNTQQTHTFQDENTNSTASNRLILQISSRTLGPNQTMTFLYVTGLTVGGNSNQNRWILTAFL
jgi:hypothetical protein